MTSNAPPFDPINPTDQENADMIRGYLAAGGFDPKPEFASVAFEHGWRMRRNDKAGVVDTDQVELTQRFLAEQREARR